ncbi:hypothetical protein PC121_g12948 [Phytophthora cactorum]|nr:hypothetical protein PC120_g14708 [Phytophthora cactorum]KAG3061559.1 hypothetical protein PC121_g12948 [Phytophthora cactorum]KAG4048406.1 hypothetical protein PC123_g16263 [Phytophthora cactorum]
MVTRNQEEADSADSVSGSADSVEKSMTAERVGVEKEPKLLTEEPPPVTLHLLLQQGGP